MKRVLIALLLALLGLLPIQAADAGICLLAAPEFYLGDDLISMVCFLNC